MRLYNIYYILKNSISVIDNSRFEKQTSFNNSFYWKFINWKEVSDKLLLLRELDFISQDALKVYYTIPPMERQNKIPEISDSIRKEVVQSLLKLINKMNAVIDLYESMKVGKANIGLDIKIPETNDFDEYISYLKDLNFILYKTPYLLNDTEKLEFSSVDVGSNWLEFVFIASGTFYILNNLALIIEKAFKFRSQHLLLKQQEQTLTQMLQKNEIGEEVIDAYKKMKDAILDEYVSDLEGELGELKNGEERDTVKVSIEKTSELIDKGVEIYSSIEAPKEVKALFPFEDNKVLLSDSLLKLIEDKQKNETKSTDK